MRKSHLFTAAALIGVLASAGAANAQLGGLGGLTGGLSGGLGAGAGGLGGTIGGSGRVVTDTTRVDRVTREAADRTRSRTQGATGAVTGTVGRTGQAIDTVRSTANAVTGATANVGAVVTDTTRSTHVVVGPPAVGLGYLGGLDVVQVGRSRALVDAGVTFIPGGQVTSYMDRQVVELRDELRGTGVDVIRRGETIVLELPSDITFAFDKADIRPRFLPVINAVSRTLNEYPATYVDVIGHADAIGSDDYNQRLSERRAAAVAGSLIARRALPERLFVAGRGESEPIASNASAQGRAENRRVEIILRPHRLG